jgi:hypothetical protein
MLICEARAENEFKKIGKAIVKAITENSTEEDKAAPENKMSFKKPESSSELISEIDFILPEIFPSFILSCLDMSRKKIEKERKPNELGTSNMVFDILAKAKNDNTKVKITVHKNNFMATDTEETFLLKKKGEIYQITPTVAWDFQKLVSIKQPINEIFKIDITVNDKYTISKVFQPKIRSINDALVSARGPDGTVRYLAPITFPAYVNENNPQIDNILRETKDLMLLAEEHVNFGAIESGATEPVLQVAAIWFYLQSKNITYSSLGTQSSVNVDIFAQSVRAIDDTLNSTQANCVDGTVLFASILRKIGIDSSLVLKPGHMYLKFYNDKEKQQPTFIETTMLEKYRIKNFEKLKMNPKGLFGVNLLKKEYQNSLKSFIAANGAAVATWNNDTPHFTSANGYYDIQIDKMREAGIAPINR